MKLYERPRDVPSYLCWGPPLANSSFMTTALGCILPWCSSKASTLAWNAQGLALSGWAMGGEDRGCSGPHGLSALGFAWATHGVMVTS